MMECKVFHGTNKKDLEFLRKGTWVTENYETAKTFGKYVYGFRVNEEFVDWEYLSPEMCDWDTKGQGEWRGTLKGIFILKR